MSVEEERRRLNHRRMMRVQQRLMTLDSGDADWHWLVLDEPEWSQEQEACFEALLRLAEQGNRVARKLIQRFIDSPPYRQTRTDD